MANDSVKVGNFKLYLNGKELPENKMLNIEELVFEDEINLPAMFTIKFNIIDFFKGAWQGIDLETFKLGDVVKVAMGFDKLKDMMTGEIAALEPTFDHPAFMIIRGYDRLYKLRFGTKRRSFNKIKDSDLAAKMASEAGLSGNAEATKTVFPYLFQNNQTNYDFLLDRAKRINYEIMADDKKLIFRKSKQDSAPIQELEYDINLSKFSVKLKTLTEGSKVEVRGWDVKKKEAIVTKSTSGNVNPKMGGKESGFDLSKKGFSASPIAIVDDRIIDKSEGNNIGKATYDTMLSEFLTGDGEMSGNPDIKAGKTIKITGLGKRFSGIYYIVSTVHSINQDGYYTRFRARRTGA